MRRALLLALIFGCSGTSDSDKTEPPCAAGLVREGATCAPKFDVCPEGQLPSFGGGCVAIGATCAAGFKSDGRGSCDPILPATCPDGQLAVAGDASCHALSDCGPEPWGNLPDLPSTRWVDAKAADGGDGSKSKPFKTVAEAVGAASLDGVVAIAAGRYTVNVDVGRAVKIHGRCAAMVELRGDPALTADHVIQATSDLELKGVSITSPYIGVGVYDANATIDSVILHDTEYAAIEALGYKRPPNITVRNTLIDRHKQIGMTLFGANAVVERSVIRNGRARADGKTGDAIVVRPRKEGAVVHPGNLSLKTSVLESNRHTGVQVFGATVTIDASVIRKTRADDRGEGGAGIIATAFEGKPADITVRGSVFEENQTTQLAFDRSTVTIEDTVARKGVQVKGLHGGGFYFDLGAVFTLRRSIAEGNKSFGVLVTGGEGTIEDTLVRDIAEERAGRGGFGIQMSDDEETHAPANVKVLRTRIDRCSQVGVLVMGAAVEAEELTILDVNPLREGIFGDGIGVSIHRVIGGEPVLTSLTLKKSLVERAKRAALTIFGADVTVESTRFSCTAIGINAERSYSPPDMGVSFERDFDLRDLGGNACGCGTPATCRVESSGIAPLN